MSKSFPVIIEQDEMGYFIVTCPVLEGCYSQGRTLKEAMENIREAIELCLEELDDVHVTVPLHNPLKRGTLRSALRQSGITLDGFLKYL